MKDKLQKLLGVSGISDVESDKLIYSTDASYTKGKVLFVVWPKNEEQIRYILNLANRKNTPLTIRGGGTSLVGGAVPFESIVLNTSKMNKILRLDLKEKTLELGPGVSVFRINRILKRFNLFFPITPFSSKVCTIGGMLATDAGCPASYGFGSILDWVHELRYMDGTGKLFRTSNKEKIKELVGSEGTLCIFTHLKLKLSKNHLTYTEAFASKTTTHLINTLNEAIKAPSVKSIEFIDHLVSLMSGLEEKYYLIITYFSNDKKEGLKQTNETKAQELRFAIEVKNIRRGAHHLTNRRHYTIIEDVYIPGDNLREFLHWLRKKSIPCFGHLAQGKLHLKFKKGQQFLIEETYSKITEFNGRPYGELGVGRAKSNFLDEQTKERMTTLKQKYDPNNILNRGIFYVNREM